MENINWYITVYFFIQKDEGYKISVKDEIGSRTTLDRQFILGLIKNEFDVPDASGETYMWYLTSESDSFQRMGP